MNKCRKFSGRDMPTLTATLPRAYEASILNPLHYKLPATPLQRTIIMFLKELDFKVAFRVEVTLTILSFITVTAQ